MNRRATAAELEGESIEDVANIRRVAKLLTSTLLPLPVGTTQAQADGWTNSALRQVIRSYDAGYNTYRPAGTQFYLKGSFWGFAGHDEREWMRDSWAEAVRMLNHGKTVVDRSRGGHTDASNLVTRWFGTSNQVTLYTKLQTLLNSMLTEFVGLCYVGGGVQAAGAYREWGPFNSKTQELKGALGSTEVGFASPGGRHAIGFFAKFFTAVSAAPRRTVLHTTTVGGTLECSRAGAVIHELSHVFLNTLDQKLADSTYIRLQMAVPGPGGHRHDAYGPKACAALAATEPDLALMNADTYRLFCEDAQVLLGG